MQTSRINLCRATGKLTTVQAVGGRASFGLRRHLDKGTRLRLTAVAVPDDACGRDLAKALDSPTQWRLPDGLIVETHRFSHDAAAHRHSRKC